MSSDQPSPAINRRQIIGGLFTLVLIAGGATALVSFVEQSTRDRIAANHAARTMKIVAEVLPDGKYDNQPNHDMRLVTDYKLLGSPNALPAYRASLDDTPVAVVLTVAAPDGYIAPIRLLVGINTDSKVVAVRALQHLETPGLGDLIDPDKSAWIEQFNGRSLPLKNAPLALRRDGGDLDHISGATITSRAVTNAVSNALRYYEINREMLLTPVEHSGLTKQDP